MGPPPAEGARGGPGSSAAAPPRSESGFWTRAGDGLSVDPGALARRGPGFRWGGSARDLPGGTGAPPAPRPAGATVGMAGLLAVWSLWMVVGMIIGLMFLAIVLALLVASVVTQRGHGSIDPGPPRQRTPIENAMRGRTLEDRIVVQLYRRAKATRAFSTDQLNAAVRMWEEQIAALPHIDKMNLLQQAAQRGAGARQAALESVLVGLAAYRTGPTDTEATAPWLGR